MPPPNKKRTRKPHKNKDIEALLQLKDKWNMQASLLIYDLIGVKRGLNGRGDSDHNIPRSRINQKLDDRIGLLINRLSIQFRDLAQSGNVIIQKQDELSRLQAETKNKSINNNPIESKPESIFDKVINPDNLSKSSSFNANLISEATNPFSRALFRLKTTFSNKPGAKLLEVMLYELLDIKNNIEEMQNAVVSSGDQSEIIKSNFEEFEIKLRSIDKIYQEYSIEIGRRPADLSSKESGYDSQFKFYETEFLYADSIPEIDGSFKRRFNNLSKAFKHSENDIDKYDNLHKINILYKELINYLKSNYQLSSNESWSDIRKFFTLGPRPLPKDDLSSLFANHSEEKILSLAHNILTRTLKKKKTELFGDSSRGLRLKLFDNLDRCRKEIIEIMNAIEQNDVDQLSRLIKEIKSSFDTIQRNKNTIFLLTKKEVKK